LRKSSTNLTTGNITKQILLFAIPIFVGQLFQTLYNSVDAIVVGNAVGTTALAAVSASADISHLLVGFFTGLSTGAGVLFARSFGAGDHKKLHNAIHTTITFSLILGTLIAALGIICSPLLLRIVDCPADVYEEALLYLRVYLIGVLFTALYNVGAGVLRAVGDSRNPLYFLVISSVTNIVLDVLLVVVLPLGVIGAALATVISQFVSVFLVVRKMLRTTDVYRLILRDLHIDRKLLFEVLDLGIPAAIQASLISISNLFVTRYINSFGSAAMAGIGAAKKIDRFAGMVAQSLGLATSTFVGQNVGAKRFDRAFQGIRICLLSAFLYVAVVGTLIYYNAETLTRVFTNDQEAISFGVAMITTMIPLYFFQACNQIFANAVRGFGKSRVVMFCSIGGMIVCRQIFLAITMHIDWNVRNIYYGYPLGWACAAIAVFVYYLFAIRRHYPEEARIRLPFRKNA